MKEILEKFVELAKTWRNLSLKYNGWNVADYIDDDLKVWCYFSDDRGHASVKFTIRRYVEVRVQFHSLPTIDGFTVNSAGEIEAAIIRYTEFADKQIAVFEHRSQQAVDAAVSKKRELLQRQLAELDE